MRQRVASALSYREICATLQRGGTEEADQRVSVVWNPDKSVTMSVPLPDDVDVVGGGKENRLPAKQQQQQQQQPAPAPRRHRNESFVMLSGGAGPAPVIAPSPSRSLTHQVGGVAQRSAAFGRMNEVNARRARLVPGWVTVFGRVYHLGV